ncbi:hypothetical protein OSB04_028626 [Centaurea solstitialis]|uniref:Uncharacterized protein n=1 Tax=Centaurea solstitialis TaxID=347529 RepID=A0AA38W7X0_9ASTR|nr:hypothetical protein OSB04_028626 [Centaurea solstitialis]
MVMPMAPFRPMANPKPSASPLWMILSHPPQTIYSTIHLVTNFKVMEIEIISKESIKPSSPTPHHLKTFELSILDQLVMDPYVTTRKMPISDETNLVTNDLKLVTKAF